MSRLVELWYSDEDTIPQEFMLWYVDPPAGGRVRVSPLSLFSFFISDSFFF